jgi:hypothetical protein
MIYKKLKTTSVLATTVVYHYHVFTSCSKHNKDKVSFKQKPCWRSSRARRKRAYRVNLCFKSGTFDHGQTLTATMSSRAEKAAALRALKEARSRKEQGLETSRADEYEIKDEGDVYEVVEEDEYQRLVEDRRQREDFVVDDGESNLISEAFKC